jgi:CHAT domain-containing protein
VLVAGAATETALRARASAATVLHIATHGMLDDRNPMYSHLDRAKTFLSELRK